VLLELRVENLLLIERAELRLAPGLNVLTGETGAGKTVLAHALDLLLGGRARSGIVRPGAPEAYVEGVFELPATLRAQLGDRLRDDADELVLARRLSPEGRTRAYIGGRTAAVGELSDVAGGLIAFYGQHEHRKLTLAAAQLDVLDAFCGAGQARRRAAYGQAYARHRELLMRLQELRELAGARDRELDLLEFELSEIDEAAPGEAEEAELRTQRERLRHLEGLRAAAVAGAEAVAPEAGGPGAAMLLAEAGGSLEALAGVDPQLDGLAERFRAVAYELDDLAAELRRYEQGVDAVPGRLEEVEDRLAVLERLERKHGGTIAAVLAHAARCRERRDELAGAQVALEGATAKLAEAEAELQSLGEDLRKARTKSAPKLARAVRERLAELAMDGAGFEVALVDRPERGPHGDQAVEFRLAPNAGVAAGPLREIASGGELSRVMLALSGVAAEAGGGQERSERPVMVFDEIDAGIGGHTARVVGERLRALAQGRQLLCITHLPQVASLAERHFTIAKESARKPARATVTEIESDAVVGELVRMLGADEQDGAARRHARELLKAA